MAAQLTNDKADIRQRIDGNWLIAHHHVSVPINVESGRALLNPEP